MDLPLADREADGSGQGRGDIRRVVPLDLPTSWMLATASDEFTGRMLGARKRHVAGDMGIELASSEDARLAAMQVLPVIASERIPTGEDRQTFEVIVRNETGQATYTATLSFVGKRLC